MKAIAFPLVLTLAAAGIAGAHETATARAYKSPTASSAKPAATHVSGEVVSVEGDKLVLKTASGEETFTATGKAAAELSHFKTGERVTVRAHASEIVGIQAEKTGKKGK
jgi:hypothetical protein